MTRALRVLVAATFGATLVASLTVRLSTRPPRETTAAKASASLEEAELESGVASANLCLAAQPEADPTSATVQDGAPRMLHLDPRHTNRSPWFGPTAPKLSWTFDTGGPIAAAPIVLDDETIVVASLSGHLFGISADGEQRFDVDLKERVYSSPLLLEDALYVGADSGSFFGLSTMGRTRFRIETDGDADTGAAPTPWGGIVFASGKLLYATRGDGTLLWRVRARRKIYASPAVATDGTVFVGSQDDHLYAVFPDGKVKWRVSLGSDLDASPAVGDDGTVFVGTDGGEVCALSPDDGRVLWRKQVGGFVRGALSIRRDGTVLAGTYGPRPRLVALSAERGTMRFEFAIQGTGAVEFGIHGAPVEDAGGRLYFGTQDDCVYGLSQNGERFTKFCTQGDVDAPVVITPRGVLLVGSEDGRLYALSENSR